MFMLKTIYTRLFVLALCIIFILLAGCAVITTKSPRFYVLSPMVGAETEKQMESGAMSDTSIGIGAISLPKYLRKSQIVTRTGSNEVQMAEFDRWAGKIEEDIGRVIAENLAYVLASDKVLSYPAIASVDTDYRIEIDIIRFDGSLGESAELIARWVIFNKQGNILKSITSTHIIEPVQDITYTDMVAAQSRALAALSHELAAAILQLPGK
jgi:uncharacterized lipoprotein YmbA